MSEGEPLSPEEQLLQVERNMNKDWGHVVDALRSATLELIDDLSDEEKLMLHENFWPTHPALMERQERYRPGITGAVISRAEEIAEERRAIERAALQQKTQPAMSGIALLRSLFKR